MWRHVAYIPAPLAPPHNVRRGLSFRSTPPGLDWSASGAHYDWQRVRDIRTDAPATVETTTNAILIDVVGGTAASTTGFGAIFWRVDIDAVVFVPTLRFDLASHTLLVADAYVPPPQSGSSQEGREKLSGHHLRLASCGITGTTRLQLGSGSCQFWWKGVARGGMGNQLRCRWNVGMNPLCNRGTGDFSATFTKERKRESVCDTFRHSYRHQPDLRSAVCSRFLRDRWGA